MGWAIFRRKSGQFSSGKNNRWKKQYAGMGINEVRRLKQLDEENRRLKQLVADLTLDKQMLQEVLSKKL